MTAPPLLLALHSCSDCFGMALLDPQQPGAEPLVQAHPDGRGLSNAAGQPQVARKAVNKVVHSDAKNEGAPDPRWAGELSKLKDLLANQKTAV